jgi:DNA-binding response OmpR family regulator
MNILLVENHRVFANTVIAQLLCDHSVMSVPNVMEALDAYRSSSFDAVLIDYDLDDFKGDVFVRRIRAGGSRVPIIAISAREDGNDALLAAGADHVCHKAQFSTIVELLAHAH